MSVCGQITDKSEVKKVRNKIIRLLDANCADCFTKKNNCILHGHVEAFKYCNERCEIGKKLQKLGKSIGDEGSPVWSDEEVYYLLNHYELFTIEHLAKRLKRTPEAVEIKLKRLLKNNKHAVVV